MDKDLFDFVDQLDAKEPVETTEEAIASDDIWSDINTALENWTSRVLDAEAQQSKSKQYQHVVEEALRRQQRDGLLSHHDYIELIHITSLWRNPLNTTSCYTLGCVAVKRDIIDTLLELYTLKQLSKHTIVEVCLKL